jgi:hypothetical protein
MTYAWFVFLHLRILFYRSLLPPFSGGRINCAEKMVYDIGKGVHEWWL